MTSAVWSSISGTPGATVAYAYDGQGDVMEMSATYTNAVTSSAATQTYWYAYDAMDNFTVTEGVVSGGHIVAGSLGDTLGYNLAGERVTDTLTVSGGTQEEFYAYGEDGYLDQVRIGNTSTTSAPAYSAAYLAVSNGRDAMGRVSAYSEYLSSGGSAIEGRTDTYENDSNISLEVDASVVSGTTTVDSTTYAYDAGIYLSSGGISYTGAYLGGNVADEHTVVSSVSGSTSHTSTTDTAYAYLWADAALESQIIYTPNVASSGTTYSSTLSYDANDHLLSAYIGGTGTAWVAYTDNAEGQIIGKTESVNGGGGPVEYYYTFAGDRRGDVGNNGAPSNQLSETQAINQATKAGSTNGWAYGSAVAYANFDQNFAPVDQASAGQAQAPGSYTAVAGDTLQSAAQNLWGDPSLWYLLADANGLTDPSQTLATGTVLTAPSDVVNLHDNANTTQVYNQYQTLGNVNPDQIAPPAAKHGGCGVGQIIMAVVAAIVTIYTLGATSALLVEDLGSVLDAMTSAIGEVATDTITDAVAGGIAGAVGAVAGQIVGLATHTISKFNWTSVAEGAIGGAVGGAVDNIPGLGTGETGVFNNTFATGVVRGALNSAISEGVDVATGLQHKFDWTGVAVGAAEAGVTAEVGQHLPAGFQSDAQGVFSFTPQGFVGAALTGGAAAIAGGAVRTLATGTDFGQNVLEELPGTLGDMSGPRIC